METASAGNPGDPAPRSSAKPPPLTATAWQRGRAPVGAVIRETGNPYFGDEDAVVIGLAAARVRARQERIKANRAAACGVCAGDPDFGVLQLQRAGCRMS
jgi:hypothetical protein